MTKKKAVIGLTLGIVVVLGGAAAIILFKENADPRTAGLTKVAEYNYVEEGRAACAAVSPACGVCFGKVIDKECYVDKAKLTPEELRLMGF